MSNHEDHVALFLSKNEEMVDAVSEFSTLAELVSYLGEPKVSFPNHSSYKETGVWDVWSYVWERILGSDCDLFVKIYKDSGEVEGMAFVSHTDTLEELAAISFLIYEGDTL